MWLPEYTPGGRAKGFYASIDVRFRRGDWITEGTGINKEIVGQVVKYKIEKNKTFKRMQSGEFDFYFAENSLGIKPGYVDTAQEVVVCGIEWGVIRKSGGWYYVSDSEKYQGQEGLVEALRNDEKLIENMKSQILSLSTNPIME